MKSIKMDYYSQTRFDNYICFDFEMQLGNFNLKSRLA